MALKVADELAQQVDWRTSEGALGFQYEKPLPSSSTQCLVWHTAPGTCRHSTIHRTAAQVKSVTRAYSAKQASMLPALHCLACRICMDQRVYWGRCLSGNQHGGHALAERVFNHHYHIYEVHFKRPMKRSLDLLVVDMHDACTGAWAIHFDGNQHDIARDRAFDAWQISEGPSRYVLRLSIKDQGEWEDVMRRARDTVAREHAAIGPKQVMFYSKTLQRALKAHTMV